MAFRSILIADDEEPLRALLEAVLREQGWEVRAVASGEEALEELARRDHDLLLTDVQMAGMDGLELLRRARERSPGLPVLVMSAYGGHAAALAAVRAGAADHLSKPFRPDDAVLAVRKVEEREALWRENRRLRRELTRAFGVEGLIGASAPMAELLRQIRRLAPLKSTALVTGESGTGKELVARALHDLSPRAGFPFVAVDCGAIPPELIESELFGHARGAFTGATRDAPGLALEADGGTLLLDEIGELPLALQPKLLRFLQEEEVRRVGDPRARRVDVRVIAATSRDLAAAARRGEFREELLYRLDVVTLRVPPLRERPGDVERLARHFLARCAGLRPGGGPEGFTPEALAALAAHRWPGNVRELAHAVERAAILGEGPLVAEEELPASVRAPAGAPPPPAEGDLSVKRQGRALEERLIRAALARTGGNRTRAAELLELSYRALLYKIREYGIEG